MSAAGMTAHTATICRGHNTGYGTDLHACTALCTAVATCNRCTPAPLVTCEAPRCTQRFYYVEARGERASLCLDHGDAHMRASGHQNDLAHLSA